MLFSCDIASVVEMTDSIRSMKSDTVIAIGGPHPSHEKPERLCEQFPAIDYAFSGEAEPCFEEFLQNLESSEKDFNNVFGLIGKDENGLIHANPKALVEDFDSLPLPARDLLKPE